jgi:hypothetical protein
MFQHYFQPVWARSALAAVAFAALLTSTVTSQAQDSAPNMFGTWNMTNVTMLLWNGKIRTFEKDYESSTIEVRDQSGAAFTAFQTSHRKEGSEPARQGDKLLISGETTRLLGIVGYDNRTIMMSDYGDTTTYQCNLIEQDRMQCFILEAGDQAIAGRIEYERSK